ncbi:hypothetical protein HELRODRAFT_187809 [Helobdella robusta]|uniref:CHHC U11-48K-type domain-containing protein n=1 Tax=Helobdella robusta TaxID=6412 RepID=T1FPE2_HELRO|nr:hypothetical protein HELRODRAFT_187809 [Helobdella robusta]ESO12245.1 hypothetical protein HELRODRAFT_187809 [Helobdella robusta]
MKTFEPDELVTCPYCQPPKTHQIRFKRLNTHLKDMKIQDPSLARMKTCRFYALHVYDKDLIDAHYLQCKYAVKQVAVEEEVNDQSEVADAVHPNIHDGESWDFVDNAPRFRLKDEIQRSHKPRGENAATGQQGIDDINKPFVPVGMSYPTSMTENKDKNSKQNQVRKVSETKGFGIKDLNFHP